MKIKFDEAYENLNPIDFISKDPIQIPHKFSKKEDIEISAFLVSLIAYGKRDIILRNGYKLMDMMNNEPYNFLINNDDFSKFKDFKHRTIKSEDMIYFLKSLKNIYQNHGGLEKQFNNDIKQSLIDFWKLFFSLEHDKYTERSVSNVEKGSAAKKLNMFLRWMVRNDKVDFGLWKNINPKNLYIPLDVHVFNSSEKLGIINRKSADWKSVEIITNYLKTLDPNDPIKYDFVLFNMDL